MYKYPNKDYKAGSLNHKGMPLPLISKKIHSHRLEYTHLMFINLKCLQSVFVTKHQLRFTRGLLEAHLAERNDYYNSSLW